MSESAPVLTKTDAVSRECSGLRLYNRALRTSEGAYFPRPESKGGWRKLDTPDEVRRLAAVDPDKLAGPNSGCLTRTGGTSPPCSSERGYIVLENAAAAIAGQSRMFYGHDPGDPGLLRGIENRIMGSVGPQDLRTPRTNG